MNIKIKILDYDGFIHVIDKEKIQHISETNFIDYSSGESVDSKRVVIDMEYGTRIYCYDSLEDVLETIESV